eukprot:COSAG06_NODE_1794_length_8377_cov_116.203068_6_plen_75_part_00
MVLVLVRLLQGLDLSAARPIYGHVEKFERALNLYRAEDFDKAAELVSSIYRVQTGFPTAHGLRYDGKPSGPSQW